jgi:hypothetical protein
MAAQDISELGYGAIKTVDGARNGIMTQVATVATGSQNTVNFNSVGGVNASQMAGITTGANIDITTGAGALVLDDVLQALSTVEQASAQLVSAENKAQQQVNSLARG